MTKEALEVARGEVLIPRAELKRRYSRSHVTIWRWEHQPDFPAPAAIIHGRRYYRLSDLEKWELRLVSPHGPESNL